MPVDQAEQLPGKRTKSVAYTDDFTGASSITNLLHWWNTFTTLGPLFGYHPEPTKCWLTVKPRMKDIALKAFENAGINKTEDGKRDLGGVTGSIEYRDNYVTQKVNTWLDELIMLCDIARNEPQAASSCFVSGYKHKVTHIMRTIPNISHQLEKIDEPILTKFILAITGGIYVNPDERYLLSLPVKYSGLGLPILSELAGIEFQNSQIMSEDLRNKIIEKGQASSQQHDKKIKENKNNIQKSMQACHNSILQRLRNDMTDEQQRLNEINQQQGASTWLTTLPIKEEGYTINKNCFWDLLLLLYGWQLQRLPTTC